LPPAVRAIGVGLVAARAEAKAMLPLLALGRRKNGELFCRSRRQPLSLHAAILIMACPSIRCQALSENPASRGPAPRLARAKRKLAERLRAKPSPIMAAGSRAMDAVLWYCSAVASAR
jgi:hypothetical protein